MPVETFRTLIAKNRRNSILLVGVFLLLFAGVGMLVGYIWGGGDMHFSVGLAVGAALIAFVLALIAYRSGGSVLLRMSGAYEVRKEQDPQLFNVVEEVSIAAGVPMPRVYLIRDTAMNAFATGRGPKNSSVAITTGLRERLTRDELQGVMAHELSHIRHNDILFATMVAVLVGTLVLLSDVFLRSMWYGAGRRRSRGNDRGGGGAQIVILILAILAAILAPILAKIIQLAISRQREYLADAGAVELTRNPEGLAGALAKLSGQTEVLEVANRATAPLFIVHPIMKASEGRKGSNLFATHPPISDRVKRIMSLTV